MKFRVSHATRYDYDAEVTLGEHRLMIRPRDSHDLRLLSASLTLTPPADVVWQHDVFGNSVGLVTFHEPTRTLTIVSELNLERYPPPEELWSTGSASTAYPFAYGADDRIDLGAMLLPERPDEETVVLDWVRAQLGDVSRGGFDATSLLVALNRTIHEAIRYEARYAEGTMTAGETLANGSGTCRDLAMLLIEAARLLGYGARFVTGYVYTPPPDDAQGPTIVGGAATHAWAEIFVPERGWIGFDPTNDLIESHDLIRVAVVRAPRQAIPIAGSFTGAASSSLSVDVRVEPLA